MAVEVRITAKDASCFQAVYYGRENDVYIYTLAYYCNAVVTFLQTVEKYAKRLA
jgi:hypothetical protein